MYIDIGYSKLKLSGPRTKKSKTSFEEPTLSDDIFERSVKDLKKELKNRKPKFAHVKHLMAETQANRRCWIVTESPSVSEILEKCPPLHNTINVSWFICVFCQLNTDFTIIASKGFRVSIRNRKWK